MKVKIKWLNDKAKFPDKKYDKDFCFDCVATSCEEVAPNVYKYGLGFALQVDEKFREYVQFIGWRAGFTIRARSSVWKTGMILSNGVGTIDELYRGEISAVFYHVLPNMPKYEVGDRVCQIHFDAAFDIDFVVANELDETERGANGYGSTGR